MDPRISMHATPKAWLLNSVLVPYADAFAAYLIRCISLVMLTDR